MFHRCFQGTTFSRAKLETVAAALSPFLTFNVPSQRIKYVRFWNLEIHLSSGTLQYTNIKYLPDEAGVLVPGYISLSILPSPMSSANQQEHGKNKGSSSSGMTSISSKKIPFPLPWVSCPTRILSTFKSGEKTFC